MSENKPFISKRHTQVWEWKDAIAREVEHLSDEEALQAILEKAHKACQSKDLPTMVTKRKRH